MVSQYSSIRTASPGNRRGNVASRRTTGRRNGPVGYWIAAVLAGIIGTVTVVTTSRQITAFEALEQRGVRVTAHVDGLQTLHGKSTTYYVTYSFIVGGRSYSGHTQLSHDAYMWMNTDGTVPVTYLPESPDKSAAYGSIESREATINRVVGCIMLAGAVSAAVAGFRVWKQPARRRTQVD